MLIFEEFLRLNRSLLIIFGKTREFTSNRIEYVAEDTKSNLKQLKPYESLWLHSSVFALEL